MLTEYQLKMYAEKFLRETYGLTLNCPLKLNGRLQTCKGRFVYSNNPRMPKRVEINKLFFENNEPNIVLDVLRHELVHYALFMLGKPYKDGDYYFERELKRLGVVSQSTINQYSIVAKRHVYLCTSCKREHHVTRRLKHNGIYHNCKCGGELLDRGKRMVAL